MNPHRTSNFDPTNGVMHADGKIHRVDSDKLDF